MSRLRAPSLRSGVLRRTHHGLMAVGRRLLAALPLLLGTARAALACPVCNTETGVAVRAGIFNAEFAPTLLATLAPFPLILGVVAALHYGWTPGFVEAKRHERPRPPRRQNND